MLAKPSTASFLFSFSRHCLLVMPHFLKNPSGSFSTQPSRWSFIKNRVHIESKILFPSVIQIMSINYSVDYCTKYAQMVFDVH